MTARPYTAPIGPAHLVAAYCRSWWRAWRTRRETARERARALDAGYRVSPATWEQMRKPEDT